MMKESRIAFGIMALILLLIIGYSSYEMLGIGDDEEYYSVSVLLDDSGNEKWAAFKEGLTQGANEYRIHLDIISTGEFTSFQSEKTVLDRILDSGSDGLILQDLYPSGSKDLLTSITDSGVKIVLTETDQNGEYTFSSVTVDQTRLGEELGKAVLSQYQGQSDLKCGVLFGDNAQGMIHQRMEGLYSVLNDSNIEVSWTTSFAGMGSSIRCSNYLKSNPVDILIALENDETEAAAELFTDENAVSTTLFGTGFSEKNVYYLDKGCIQVLIVPNEYYQGYRCINVLAEQMQYHTQQVTHEDTEFLTVTSENLYSEEYEKILFPVVR